MKVINAEVMFPLKVLLFILLGECMEVVLCAGFTYDDDYAEINSDNYGFDLSELHHVTAEQPKYNKMIRGYRGPPIPNLSEKFAVTERPCDVDKYKEYLYPIHVLKTNGSIREKAYKKEVENFKKVLFEKQKNGSFTWQEVCYHKLNALYCKDGKCKCLEVEATNFYGIREESEETFDPMTFSHYRHCRIQESYGCKPTHTLVTVKCDKGLYCHRLGTCIKASSSENYCNFWTLATILIFSKILSVLLSY